jgi:hypothetical protein
MSSSQRRIGSRLATAGLALIAVLTLIPNPEGAALASATPLACIVCGDLGGVDFLLNILLFIPLGIGLGLIGFSLRRTVVLAALLSLSIELLQMKVIAGRDASLGDVITNTLGGGVGVLLGTHWRQLVFPNPRAARRLALMWALTLGWIWVGTSWALGPMWPVGARWYGQWAANLGHLHPFLGKPLWITAGGEPLLPGRPIDEARLEDAVAAFPSMAFRAVLGSPTNGLAPVGSIYDGRQREVMLLGQDGKDLAFRIRMRASIAKLRGPLILLTHGMDGAPGDTVEAEGALRSGVLELASRRGGSIRSRRLPLSASWGWVLVMPWNFAIGPEVQVLTALWVAGLLTVLSYWSVLAGQAALGIIPATTTLLLLVVPVTAGFRPAHWTEWASALSGAAAGWVLTRVGRHAVGLAERPG